MSTENTLHIKQTISFNGSYADLIIANNFILLENTNEIDQNNNKFKIKYLNLQKKQWENIKFNNQHVSLITLLFPRQYKRIAAVRFLNSNKQIAYLYIINRKWNDTINIYTDTFCKLMINLATKTLFDSIKLPSTTNDNNDNNNYDEIFNIKCTDNKCHVFSYKQQLRYSSQAKICHSIINDSTHKHEILHLINWINIADGGFRFLILDNDAKSFYMQQIAYTQETIRLPFQRNFTFHKYNSTKNIWNQIQSMTHLIDNGDKNKNIHHSPHDSTSLFINNVKIHFDFYSTKIWIQNFNSNSVQYIATGHVLPCTGDYEIWFSHENKQIESILINGFTRRLTSVTLIQFPPQYLMDIILHFFHFPQINFILRELLESPAYYQFYDSKLCHVGQYWSINSSDLLLDFVCD